VAVVTAARPGLVYDIEVEHGLGPAGGLAKARQRRRGPLRLGRAPGQSAANSNRGAVAPEGGRRRTAYSVVTASPISSSSLLVLVLDVGQVPVGAELGGDTVPNAGVGALDVGSLQRGLASNSSIDSPTVTGFAFASAG
jgi:hypothetical protein